MLAANAATTHGDAERPRASARFANGPMVAATSASVAAKSTMPPSASDCRYQLFACVRTPETPYSGQR